MPAHVVDTFCDARFAGNPAAVVTVARFPATGEMQRAAADIGLPTTAFVVPNGPGCYRIRWFTPAKELNLCGHATIASARYLFSRPADAGREELSFDSEAGRLHTRLDGVSVAIDLPSAALCPQEAPPSLLAALGLTTIDDFLVSSDDVLVVVPDAAVVRGLTPDFEALARLPHRGHVVTAPGGDGVDFVSRTFFPAYGVDEDQVCVTAHCKLTPYWAARLGRPRLVAEQLSERGGRLEVEDLGDRVRVRGSAVMRDRASPGPARAGAPGPFRETPRQTLPGPPHTQARSDG